MFRRFCMLFIFILILVIRVSAVEPTDPVDFGMRELKNVLAKTPGTAGLRLQVMPATKRCFTDKAVSSALRVLPAIPESFAIVRVGNELAIVGRDEVGAMYGCFELAERLEMKGAAALHISKPIVQSPAVRFRGVNLFLSLPYGETEENWWFLSRHYWEGYLDRLAHARINWVDLHGMYDIKGTGFPNIYPYFIKSEKFPEVGVDPHVADRNLAMLNEIVSMAKRRGIRFALMSYSARWDGPGLRKPPYESSEENLTVYTREVVRKMIEQCPGLEMIGFRIGESGKSENFYRNTYIPAIKEAGRRIDLPVRGVQINSVYLKLAMSFPVASL